MLLRYAPLLLVTACAAATVAGPSPVRAGSRPDWLEGNLPLYPSSRYLSGIGDGDDRSTAEDRARAKVAAVFRTDILARSTSTIAEQDASIDGRLVHAELTQASTQQVDATSKKTLTGVEIAEVWQDPETRLYHALAVLESDRVKIGKVDHRDIGKRAVPELQSGPATLPARPAFKHRKC